MTVSSDPSKPVDRVEMELSIRWAEQNPTLFAQRYNGFLDQYGQGWTVSAQARQGFLTLVAQRTPSQEQLHQSPSKISPHDLLMSCPEDQVTRMKIVCRSVLDGDWTEAAHHLRAAAREGDTPWHRNAAVKAQEYEVHVAHTAEPSVW